PMPDVEYKPTKLEAISELHRKFDWTQSEFLTALLAANYAKERGLKVTALVLEFGRLPVTAVEERASISECGCLGWDSRSAHDGFRTCGGRSGRRRGTRAPEWPTTAARSPCPCPRSTSRWLRYRCPRVAPCRQ